MAVRRKKKPEQTAYCVYLGPSMRGKIEHGKIFAGTAASVRLDLAELIKTYPPVGALLIDASALAEARVRIRTPGTALHEQLRRLKSMLGG